MLSESTQNERPFANTPSSPSDRSHGPKHKLVLPCKGYEGKAIPAMKTKRWNQWRESLEGMGPELWGTCPDGPRPSPSSAWRVHAHTCTRTHTWTHTHRVTRTGVGGVSSMVRRAKGQCGGDPVTSASQGQQIPHIGMAQSPILKRHQVKPRSAIP